MHSMNWFGGGWIMMMTWWLFLILVIAFLVNLLRGSRSQPTVNETPVNILKKRYARGEITREEFENMKKNITVTG